MVRAATKFDLPDLRDWMRQFRDESPISFLHDVDNADNFDELFTRVISGAGVCLIDEGKGFILGAIYPSVWCNKSLVLSELAWWVKPEYRGGTSGYRLLKRYVDTAIAMKEEGRIKAFTMAKMVNSPDIKYQKFGFSKLEESWIQ